MKSFLFAGLLLWVSCFSLNAAEFVPAVLYGGEIFDKSFNEAVHRGVIEFQEKTGISSKEVVAPYEIPPFRKKLLELTKEGANPIIVPPSTEEYVKVVEKTAIAYPDTAFIIIDYEVDLPNVYSILFKEHEGSFLAGMLAAMASKTQKIGFVGGMDIPIISDRFGYGFEQGVRYISPKAEIFMDYVGTTDEAWYSPEKGKAIADAQLKKGVDVIYHAAGETGRGVLEAAAKAKKLGIGVDSNQNHLFPGYVLTSMMKNIDKSVYIALFSYQKKLWRDNIKKLGIAQKGVDLAFDKYNASLITKEMKERIKQARNDILLGGIVVSMDRNKKTVFIPSKMTSNFKKRDLTIVCSSDEDFPYLLSKGNEVDERKPGLVIDALRLLENRLNLKIRFKRQPVKRCFVSLKNSSDIDGLICTGFTPESEKYGVFPMRMGKLDEDRRFLNIFWYFYIHKDTPLSWDGKNISNFDWTIGAINGTSIIGYLESMGLTVQPKNSYLSLFKMLGRKRLDAIVAVDLNGDFILKNNPDFKTDIIKLEPEVTKEYYYLMFSHQFYKEHLVLAETIWNTLSEIRESIEYWEQTDKYFTRQ